MATTLKTVLKSYDDFVAARRAKAAGDVQLAEAMGNRATVRLYDLARDREVAGKPELASALRDLGRMVEMVIPGSSMAEH